MKNILLIDDLANKGWKSILEKAIVKDVGNIQTASSYSEACERIKEKASLIFLDVRLTEEDHNQKNISQMSGFQILEKIKRDFTSTNFSTPIILLTASNKIWIIEEFKQYGIDTFYIKEHPDNGFSKELSRENLERLQSSFSTLLILSDKRNDIWQLSKDIVDKLSSHKYFNEGSGYVNVKQRITDKLKLGYSYLFSDQTEIEKRILKSDNESLAFIIYWSILEEIVKGYSEKNNWNKSTNYSFSGKWKFRNNSVFIEKDKTTISIEPYRNSKGEKYEKKQFELVDKSAEKYEKGHINLSDQIYALLYHYEINQNSTFKKLNEYRNKIDYIHSSLQAIYDSPVLEEINKSVSFKKIKETLYLINEILKFH